MKTLIELALKEESWQGALFNVNIPALPADEIKGIKYCRQSEARWVEHFVKNEDPRGRSYYWLAGEFVNEDERDDTDVAALEAGFVSVVPSMHDLTDYDLLQKIYSNGLSN